MTKMAMVIMILGQAPSCHLTIESWCFNTVFFNWLVRQPYSTIKDEAIIFDWMDKIILAIIIFNY